MMGLDCLCLFGYAYSGKATQSKDPRATVDVKGREHKIGSTSKSYDGP